MNLDKYDAITRREIEFFVERKDAEQQKIRGQIARDLRRIGGEYGFLDERNYRLLREKYLRGHQSKKKLAILEMLKVEWCK
ncbi:MAG: hypothetical protein IJQ82_11785 [Selenomonadaceae bacterium]|nr:hypothetical protein [Selenomonadaceae bacterium]